VKKRERTSIYKAEVRETEKKKGKKVEEDAEKSKKNRELA
jgi:hypothetical protein